MCKAEEEPSEKILGYLVLLEQIYKMLYRRKAQILTLQEKRSRVERGIESKRKNFEIVNIAEEVITEVEGQFDKIAERHGGRHNELVNLLLRRFELKHKIDQGLDEKKFSSGFRYVMNLEQFGDINRRISEITKLSEDEIARLLDRIDDEFDIKQDSQ